jgi:hypothetical protein
LNKGDKADFLDSTEQKMNKIFSENKYALSELENMLISKKGKEWFELNYEKKIGCKNNSACFNSIFDDYDLYFFSSACRRVE